jgi:hypothetical protein
MTRPVVVDPDAAESKTSEIEHMESKTEHKEVVEDKPGEVEDTIKDGFVDEPDADASQEEGKEEQIDEEILTEGKEEEVESEANEALVSEEKEEPIDEKIEADEQEEKSEERGNNSETNANRKSEGKEVEEKSEAKEDETKESERGTIVDVAHKPVDFNFEQCELCKDEDGIPLCEYLDEGEKIGKEGTIYKVGKSFRCKGREVVERYYLNELMIEHDWPVCDYCFSDNERLYSRKWEISTNSVPLCAAGFFSCTGLGGELVDMVEPVGWPEHVFLQRRDEFYKQEGVHCCGDRIILCENHQHAYDEILSRPITEILPGADHYEGQYHNGKRHGEGKLLKTSKDGPHKDAKEYYEGQWENDTEHGKGAWHYQGKLKGYSDVSEWQHGARFGLSTVFFPFDGQTENRESKRKGDTLPHGIAEKEFDDGAKYKGQWILGVEEGKGKYWYKNGDVYEGSFCDGRKHGKGYYKWQHGNKYKGQWFHGVEKGEGKKWYSNGDYYEGQFEQGKRHGIGEFKQADGSSYKGGWKHDIKHGDGQWHHANCDWQEDVWRNGKKHGHSKVHKPEEEEVSGFEYYNYQAGKLSYDMHEGS